MSRAQYFHAIMSKIEALSKENFNGGWSERKAIIQCDLDRDGKPILDSMVITNRSDIAADLLADHKELVAKLDRLNLDVLIYKMPAGAFLEMHANVNDAGTAIDPTSLRHWAVTPKEFVPNIACDPPYTMGMSVYGEGGFRSCEPDLDDGEKQTEEYIAGQARDLDHWRAECERLKAEIADRNEIANCLIDSFLDVSNDLEKRADLRENAGEPRSYLYQAAFMMAAFSKAIYTASEKFADTKRATPAPSDPNNKGM